jgi:accessory gene regulator protein AgrB
MEENDKVLILKLLLKATFVLLFISVALKLLGLNVFGINDNYVIINTISDFLDSTHLNNLLCLILIYIQSYLIFRIICKNQNRNIYFFTSLIATTINIAIQYIVFNLESSYSHITLNILYFILSYLLLIIFSVYIDKDIKVNKIKGDSKIIVLLITIWQKIKSPVMIIMLIPIYQLIIIFLRNITFFQLSSSLYNIILNFDYTILLLATLYVKLNKNIHYETNNFFESNIINILGKNFSIDEIKIILLKLRDFNKKFKEAKKIDKITIIIYLFFVILSEIINLSLVIFVAYINNALIECLFIITSFLISRKVFGAFHLDSAIKCWMLSNITFYLLSKISLNVGITFVIPILCGIALSYITSKFIKKNSKDLYKGISERDLIELSQNKNLTKLEFEILKKYYCEGTNINKLTFIYHYSRAQLYRYKSNAEKKIAS